MWTTFHMGHYVPLSWMTLGVDYRLWGMNPAGYHLTNLLLHAGSAVVVFFLARRLLAATLETSLIGVRPQLEDPKWGLTPIDLPAAIAALLFAVHPLRVESVAWVTERRDVLSGFLYFSSILAYLRWRDDDAHMGWYVATLVLFASALLSKATAMTLPAVLLILNVYPLRRIGGAAGWWSGDTKRVYREIAPFAVLSAGAAALSIVALHPPSQLGIGAKLAVSAYSLMFYAWKTLVPTGLSPLYEMPQHIDPADARYVAGYAFTAAIALVAWFARRRWPAVTAALLAFVIITLPMLGVVQNGPQIAADRYTYYSAPALTILVAAGLASVIRSGRLELTTGASGAVVIAFCALTWTQSSVWHDSKTLWARVLEIDDNSSIAHSSMAKVMYGENNVDAGIAHSRRAIDIAPGYPEAHNSLGVGLQQQGQLAEAIAEYDTAIAINPQYADGENDLGIALAQQGDAAGAIRHYARALEINPDNSNAQVNWGNALVRLDKPDEAIEHYEAALRSKPDNAEAHHNWGVALARQGKFADAIEQFRMTLTLDPSHAEAKMYLEKATQLLAQQGRTRPPD